MPTATHAPPPTAGPADEHRRDDAREYVQQLRAFAIHAAVFAAGMALIFVVNLTTNLAAGIAGYWWAWWSGWALIGWSVGLGIHGFVVRLSRPEDSSSAWEERQIDRVEPSTYTEPRR